MKSGSRNRIKGFDGGVGSVYGMFIIALILCLFLLSLRKRNVGFFSSRLVCLDCHGFV